MTTLIMQRGWNGKTLRRCDAKCHTATGSECNCICRGVLHGKGQLGAAALIKELALVEPHPKTGMILITPVERELEFTEEN